MNRVLVLFAWNTMMPSLPGVHLQHEKPKLSLIQFFVMWYLFQGLEKSYSGMGISFCSLRVTDAYMLINMLWSVYGLVLFVCLSSELTFPLFLSLIVPWLFTVACPLRCPQWTTPPSVYGFVNLGWSCDSFSVVGYDGSDPVPVLV